MIRLNCPTVILMTLNSYMTVTLIITLDPNGRG